MPRTANKKKETLSATLIKNNASSVPEPESSSTPDLEKNSSDASSIVPSEKKTNKSPKKNATDAAKGSAQTKLELQKKIEQLEKLIVELTQKQTLSASAPSVLASPIAEETANDIKKIKTDLLDVGSNVFHLQKIAKDTHVVLEARINQLLVKVAFLIILSTLIIVFLLFWLGAN